MRALAQATFGPLLVSMLVACSSSTEHSGSGSPAKDLPTGTAAASGSPGGAPAASASASPTAAASASATATVAAVDEGPPVCQRSNEKVWSAGANKLTGLTTKGFDGKVAIGLALGNDPRVLVIDKDGSAKLMKVKQGAKAKLPPGKEAFRNLMRVSPQAIDGDEARAFIDYRDDYKDKRRHVWCGPADADEKFLEYEGTSWLDMDPKPTGEDKKKLFSWKKLGGYVELRDCRTFVSRKDNEVWALGSVLRGIEKPDGTNEWKMVFLVDFGKKDDEIVLHEAQLKGDPPKATSFEIPISRRIKDKGWLIATRFGGSLLVGLLDNDRKLKGAFKSYKGFPSMPDIETTDESQMILTTGIGFGADRSLKALILSKTNPELPADYQRIKLDPSESAEKDSSFSAPELTMDDKGRRWLVYIEGPANKGHLRMAPLGIDLQPIGRTFTVTQSEAYSSEARLVALPGGKLVIAYLRDKEGKTELVTEQLSCDVKK
jgi:hypothetical protein